MTEDDNKASLAARARALDPVHLAAYLASSGWNAVLGRRWIPHNPADPEQVAAAVSSAARATGQDLDALVSAVERAPHDAFIFAPARSTPDRLPPLARTLALADALYELVLAAAPYDASLFGRGADGALTLGRDLMLAPLPGEPEALALLAASPLGPEEPRLGPPLTRVLEEIAAAGSSPPEEFVLRTAASRLRACAAVYEGGLAVIVRPTILRTPRERGRAMHLPPQTPWRPTKERQL